MKHSNFSNSKGITMVSLVVTIIVLLILATIGIMAVTGDNGILSSSIRAKNEAEQSSKNIIENEENFIGDINQGYSGTEAGKNIFSIEYDNNGGEGGPQKQNAATDGDSVNITITETEPTKKDSTFLGWSENKDATSPEYEPGKSYEIAENKILYAVYVSNKGTVTINPNGGKWRDNTSTYQINGTKDQKVTLDNPTPPAGYTVTFNGNGGSEPDAKTSTKSFTSWSKSGSGTLNGTTFTFGAGNTTLTANYRNNSITLPSSTRNGYTFLGWYDAATNGSEIGNGGAAYTPTANKTLYAHWDDTTIPTMGTLTKSPTGWTKGNVTLTGKARDLGSGITAYQFSTNSELTASSDGWTSITKTTSEITKTYTATSNDTYYFYVKDDEGNVNKSSIIVNNIDRTAPNSSISAGSVNNKTITLTARGSDSQSGVATYEFYVGGKLVSTQTTSSGTATCKYTTTFGSVNAYVIVTDAVGNTKQSSTITIWDYTIKTLAELKTFRDRVNSGTTYQGNTITQIANIDIGGSSAGNWTPIGTDSHRFNGTYNGNNYTISGLYINHSSGDVGDRGLFGNTDTSSNIKNLTITNANVTTISVNSGICVGFNRGKIENVKIDGGSLIVGSFGGAIAGNNAGGTISLCSNSATVNYSSTVSSTVETKGGYIGGIAGITGGTIEKCINTGTVRGTHAAGGIAGQGNAKIQECVNKGYIYSTEAISSNTMIGGIIGFAGWDGIATITNCYNTGTVQSAQDAGGIVGNSTGSGGKTTISNCYNIGSISSNRTNGIGAVGGILAGNNSNQGSTLTNNYWLSTSGPSYGIGWNQVSGVGTNTGSTSKSATEIKNLTGTLGSAFKKDTSNKNNGYPILSWQ